MKNAIIITLGLIGLLSIPGYCQTYPYPQNYTLDQRRFDTQQAANLTMRRLQSATTGQWAVGVVDMSAYAGAVTSTATYGVALTTTTASPVYSVKRWSVYYSGTGTAQVTTNKSDGILYLSGGLGYEQIYDSAVSSLSLTIGISTGTAIYTITGVR
jgi:hypothetical protein